ncbi:MAG: DUF4840 domain-containing protein [Prevotella sp.]|nr:DUF4840 domain-containing protein [Prevotella sp.]MDD7461589.1 DUF4840 domain-containing protein [Prevotellaceae bacterium]MDY3365164.1 DUF4840 domain-containing protein [Prevotella sp.]MDY3852440.1 DUF4840 domain-containing protein [Prevotella sp.]
MKRLKNTILVMACFVTLSTALTACIGNDNEDNYVYTPLTPAEKSAQINNMAGTYRGKALLYLSDGYRLSKKDSADITLTVATDSTLRINNFPLRLLTHQLTNEALKTAVKTQTTAFISNIFLYKPFGIERQITNHQDFHFFSLWNASLPSTEKIWTIKLPYTYNNEQSSMSMTLSVSRALGLNAQELNMYNKKTNGLVYYLVPENVKWDATLNVEPFNGFIVITAKK